MSSTLESLQLPTVVHRAPKEESRRAGIGFAATILTSAFLLFEVQPLLSKFILPWFGGSPAVWTTAMLFFQVMLFAGYAYAHLLTRLFCRRRWQVDRSHRIADCHVACLVAERAPKRLGNRSTRASRPGASWRCWPCALACPIWCWPRPVRWSKPGTAASIHGCPPTGSTRCRMSVRWPRSSAIRFISSGRSTRRARPGGGRADSCIFAILCAGLRLAAAVQCVDAALASRR